MTTRVKYPVFLVASDDPTTLEILESEQELEATLEEFRDLMITRALVAWDSTARRLEFQKETKNRSSVHFSIRDDSEEDLRGLRTVILQYGEVYDVIAKPVEGEPTIELFNRVHEKVEAARWKNRPWWRRMLGLPNTTALRCVQ